MEALTAAFASIDSSLVERGETSGTCAVVALLERPHEGSPPHTIHLASLGDSKAILGRASGPPLELSVSHKPGDPSEQSRVEAAGGEVLNVAFDVGESASAADRVCLPGHSSGLAVSRAFGVANYKANSSLTPEAQLVISTPSVVSHRIEPVVDQFLLLASDGVWDVMKNEEADEFVRKELRLANKQVLRILAENFGQLHVEVVTTRDVANYSVGEMVDFPKSRDKVKGYVMATQADDGSNAGPGQLHVRATPPEAWEGGWQGQSDKGKVALAWPCGIVCEKILDRALELGSGDNMSAILVLLGNVGMAGHDGSSLDTHVQGRGLEKGEKRACQHVSF